jgi:hypothetical protein
LRDWKDFQEVIKTTVQRMPTIALSHRLES